MKTGQFTEYSSGDDGTYQAGIAFSYQTADPAGNGEIVTIDNVTGLMWASDGNAAGCNFGNQTDWFSALECYNNLTFGGYDDWRLPNVKELQSIIDYGTYGFIVDTTYFPNTKLDFYWSSTTNDLLTSNAWRVYFDYGYVGYNNKTLNRYVRGVRGGI